MKWRLSVINVHHAVAGEFVIVPDDQVRQNDVAREMEG